jgi:hypothetical protein
MFSSLLSEERIVDVFIGLANASGSVISVGEADYLAR